MFRHPVQVVLVLLLGLPLLAGCGALVGQRFDNFTAFYNTFYNAQQDFERAERAILRADVPVDRTRFLSLFHMPAQGAGGGTQGFDSAIRRAADILRDHPGSRWVDDALLLIGKSYFYQGNYDAAIQKFREVISVEDTALNDEATLWLGRALMEARAFGEAAFVLRQGIARDGAADRWTARMRLALGEVDLRQGALADAAAAIGTALDDLNDAELAARAAFLLGQTREALGDFDAAAESYERTLRLRPRSELVYAAELQRTLALARSGRTAGALERLERLRRDDRFFQQRAEIELVRGRVLAFDGQPEEARQLLYQLLYEPEATMRIDRVRGQIHYRLGEIFRDGLEDFPRAAAHFDTASTSLRQGTAALRDMRTTREAILDVERLAQSYGTYSRVYTRIAEMDSLLYLGGLDDEAFEQAIEVIAEQRRRDLLAAERERRRMEDQQGFGGAPGAGNVHQSPDQAAPGQAEGGFLGFRNPTRVQENFVAFQARWGDRPQVPNWRRRAAVAAAGRATGDDFDERLGPAMTTDDAFFGALVDVSAVPRSPEAYHRMRSERAVARYELGNVLFLTLDDPDRAANWYERVLDEDTDLPISVRARYALAEIYADRGDGPRAEALYAELSELPEDEPLARIARERLGRPVAPLPRDSVALAEQLYASAFERWSQGRQAAAFRAMLHLSDQFPGTDASARARLAAGMIYTEWAARDTLALIATTPQALLHAEEGALEESGVASDPAARQQRDAASIPAGTDRVDQDEQSQTEVSDEVSEEALVSDTADGTIFPEELLDRQRPVEAEAPPEPPTRSDAAERGSEPSGDSARTGAAGTEESWLEELYTSIERDFPGSRFAQRAQLLRQVIREQRQAVEAQRRAEEERRAEEALLAEAAEESRGEDEATEEVDEAASELQTEDPPETVPDLQGDGAVEFDEADLKGGDVLQPDLGGYSWLVLSTPRSFEAENRLVDFHNAGFRTAILRRGDDRYDVLIGQFASRAEALAARGSLPAQTDRAAAELIELEPGTELQSAHDLLSR